MKNYPINPEWYHILWVTIVLIILMIGDIWARSPNLQASIKRMLVLSGQGWVVTILKIIGWVSLSWLILVWGVYSHWIK